MSNEIFDLIEKYHKWLRDKTVLKQKGDAFEITTPYLDRHNDYIQIYLKKHGDNEFVLTDDGETVGDLEIHGCNITQGRKKIFVTILNGFGVSYDENTHAIEVKSNHSDFALKKHNLLQAICSVGDMFCLAADNVANIFIEDVKSWFIKSNFLYTSDINIIGKTGFNRNFSFVIPRSGTRPERFIKPINYPNKTSADHVIMDWLDTKDTRDDSKIIVIANDNDKQIPDDFSYALGSYGIDLIPWSIRDKKKELLAA